MNEKGKMRPAETILKMGEEEKKENDGGCELNSYVVSTFVNVTMYSQYNNNMIILKRYYFGNLKN
jgi:hypothetical protein